VSETLTGEALLLEPHVIQQVDGFSVYLIERRAMGEDWVLQPAKNQPPHPPRFVFFSLKGGVGRSTALALWAHHLCQQGKTLLVVDLDLEAPGLGTQLLERKGKPLFGVADWLVEDIAGNDVVAMVPDMARQSPVVPAGLWVVPAFGSVTDASPQNVIAKLARAYLDKSDEQGQQHFAQRLRRMVAELEQAYSPDVVLIDSRAGLHETVAASLLHLDAEVLCFATDLEVTWQGYRYLFSHLSQLARSDGSAVDWRERFKMISARSKMSGFNDFVGRSYGLWSDTLYEESDEPFGEGFGFDEQDDSAPHYPLMIPRSDTFEAFDPCRDLNRIEETQLQQVFGELFRGLDERLEIVKDEH
jgi:cellulose biosynthesis protein BcsQ